MLSSLLYQSLPDVEFWRALLKESFTMELERVLIEENAQRIPCVLLTPKESFGSVLVIHGYGGCKEEILGLAMRIAEVRLTVCVIDQLGHGENELALSEQILDEIEAAIKFCRKFGKAAAVVHSSGGRFSLFCSADFTIGISPALASDYGAKTRELLDNLRSYRVKERYAGINYTILKSLPLWTMKQQSSMILFGSRDVPEIKAACERLQGSYTNIFMINGALHNDIYLLEETFLKVTAQLKDWFAAD
jgi:hypothetical protein